LQIVDCRPKLNADVNRARGKGYERPQDYPNTQIAFMGIENIHAMRASLKAFLALMKPRSPHHAFAHGREDREEQGWLGELEKSGWIEYVRGVLRAAVTVTRHVHIGRSSVLVHCSDGWDRTAQVTAIAQLLLDGSFRSRDGFQRLVQKEWLDFGHQFALRLGSLAPLEKGTHSPSDEQLSPVFLQFVECVWHLCQQMPRAFEFNTSYLAALLHHALACETGTFLCNCERQRVALELPALTASAWDMLGGEEFRNFEYEPSGDVLLPDVSASTLRPWSAYYCRAGRRLRDEPLQLAEARCAALANENSQLREALRRLGPSKAADDGEAVAVVPAVETSPGVAQAQPRLEVHEAHVEVHALAHQGAALLCEEEEFGSAPDASSSVEDDDE
jgi:limonene-1,2-epoxide hydrolase